MLDEQKRAETQEPTSFELMSVFIFGLLCARVTCTVCTGVREPTLTVLFASYRQAACSVGRPRHRPRTCYLSF